MAIDWNRIQHFDRQEFFPHGEVEGVEPHVDLVTMLDEAREAAGIRFIITSGIRTAERNRRAGGVPDSSHITGLGVDLACTSSRARFLMLSALLGAGFTRIGIGETFIHVDIDRGKASRVAWHYYPDDEG